jgi:hypothetical protein
MDWSVNAKCGMADFICELFQCKMRECRQWFAIVQADPEPLPETGKPIGLDVGQKSFVCEERTLGQGT